MAASGAQAEAALRSAIADNAGKYVLVVEGSIPTRDDGVYMELGGRPAIQVVKEVAAQAAAVIAIGSCASWGGVPSADPNPTGAVGVDSVISGKPIVNLPGCPPNPYNLLAVVLEYVTMGRLPQLDQFSRPKFAYDRVIHENCPRRAHFDAGRFAAAFGDEGHRKGWCLYKLGCKGPVTHAACATRHFNEIPGVWPIGTGVPCVGCTEKGVVWQMGTFETVPIHLATPPDTYPPIYSTAGQLRVGAAALVGAIAGAVGGAAWVASQRFQSSTEAGRDADRGRLAPRGKSRKGQPRSQRRRKRTDVAITRRQLITGIAKAGVPAAVAIAVGTDVLQAGEHIPVPSAAVGLLYDASICIGCKACVAACAEANDTPPDTAAMHCIRRRQI